MREKVCDLFTEPADAKCLTTNGFVKKNGAAVMGAGVAKEARYKFPGIEFWLGDDIRKGGNVVHFIGTDQDSAIWFSFPVKHNWWEPADLDLIKQSAEQLVDQIDERTSDMDPIEKVLIPRPGCGNGQRDWETEVKPILEPILDDRFVVIDRA